MTPEEEEIQQDIQKGINTATTGILRFLMIHLAMRTPPEKLPTLSAYLNRLRHDPIATTGLGVGGQEAYSQIYDHVESALNEVIDHRN